MIEAKLPLQPLRNARLDEPKPSAMRVPSTNPMKRPKSTRAGKPKTRTGCVTCKIRRIKCDETKPACNRCTSTGRKCDGYRLLLKRSSNADFTPNHSATSTEPGPCLHVVAASGREAQAVEFFHARTARALASYFDDDFWGRQAFQMCDTEPAIRHALAALGTLHRQRDLLGLPRPYRNMHVLTAYHTSNLAWRTTRQGTKEDTFALAQYNKAVSSLAARIGSITWTPEMTLLVCIMFICIEFLRGDSTQASRHFTSGMQIAIATMREYEQKSDKASSARLNLLRKSLMPFFTRLQLLAAHWGKPTTSNLPIVYENAIPLHFHNIREARESLIHIINLVLQFVNNTHLARFTGTISLYHHVHQQALQDQLSTWHDRLQTFLLSHTLTPRDRTACQILELHCRTARIWLTMSTENNELSTDSLYETWLEAIELAESVMAATSNCHPETLDHEHSHHHDTSTFAFDMELVSPLYFITLVCRHPLLRRRALLLQQTISRRARLWDSKMAAILGAKFIQIEERNLHRRHDGIAVHDDDDDENDDDIDDGHSNGIVYGDGTKLPLDEDRIYNAEIDTAEPGIHPRVHVVTFYQRVSERRGGGWKVWKEELVVEKDTEEENENGEEEVCATVRWGSERVPSRLCS